MNYKTSEQWTVSAVSRYLGDRPQPSELRSLLAGALWSFRAASSPVTCCFLLKDLLDQQTGIRYCAKCWKIHWNCGQCPRHRVSLIVRHRWFVPTLGWTGPGWFRQPCATVIQQDSKEPPRTLTTRFIVCTGDKVRSACSQAIKFQ
jgi:hypothetical protein